MKVPKDAKRAIKVMWGGEHQHQFHLGKSGKIFHCVCGKFKFKDTKNAIYGR